MSTITLANFKPINQWSDDPRVKERIAQLPQDLQRRIAELGVPKVVIHLNAELCLAQLQREKIKTSMSSQLQDQPDEIPKALNESKEIRECEDRMIKAHEHLSAIEETGVFYDDGQNMCIQDESTGDLYFNETDWTIRIKGIALLVFSFFWAPIALVETFSKRLAALSNGENMLKNIVHLLLLDWIIVGLMFLSSIYTILCPHEGRKAFATWQRCLHDGIESPSNFSIAPCFQPRVFADGSKNQGLTHFFGGIEGNQNAF